jgi:uncharacterized protein (TIGR03032 family)
LNSVDSIWEAHERVWRDPASVISGLDIAAIPKKHQLECEITGPFWDLLAETETTLLVSREYEHFLVALSSFQGKVLVSFLPLPHPSGVSVQYTNDQVCVWVACTRNPNTIIELRPARQVRARADYPATQDPFFPLVPVASRFFPGCFRLHDLALIGNTLHGNAVGENAIICFAGNGAERVWWPRTIERDGLPDFTRNHIQLNSIAAGESLEQSFFSASCEYPGPNHPGDPAWPVDKRGVIFAGGTRSVLVRGLTRPHSARLRAGRLWVENSGYGELGRIDGDRFEMVARLPGWTRGLAFAGKFAIVGTSRVIPRFRQYAPGLNAEKAVCGLHFINVCDGSSAASLIWPTGNQIFAIEALPSALTKGLPFSFDPSSENHFDSRSELFYSFMTR